MKVSETSCCCYSMQYLDRHEPLFECNFLNFIAEIYYLCVLYSQYLTHIKVKEVNKASSGSIK